MTIAVQIPDTSPLPDDPLLLQEMVHELLATLHATQRRAEQLEQRLDQLLRRLYGPRSERANPDQPLLFAEEPKEERDASLPSAPPELPPQSHPAVTTAASAYPGTSPAAVSSTTYLPRRASVRAAARNGIRLARR